MKEILRLRSNINVGQVKRSSLWRWREKAKINSANFQMLMKNCGWKSRGFRFLSGVGLKVEICLKVFQWDYRKHCRLAAAESLAISSNVVCSSLVKSWKTKSPLHTHHCNLSLPPFTCDCCNYVNSSLILVIVSGITSFGLYFSSSLHVFCSIFPLILSMIDITSTQTPSIMCSCPVRYRFRMDSNWRGDLVIIIMMIK